MKGLELPKFLSKYFWDVDFEKLNVGKYPFFIIERILEYGDRDAVMWMLDNFRKSQIKRTLLEKRNFSARSANYWSSVLGVPKNKVLCLKKSYQKMRKTHWPY
jgi:hypothetical protein